MAPNHRHERSVLAAVNGVSSFLAGQGQFPGDLNPISGFFGRLYFLFGAVPPTILIANAALASATVPLIYYAGKSLGWESRWALGAAATVGFWPPSIALNAQVLRDPYLVVLHIVHGDGIAGLLAKTVSNAAGLAGARSCCWGDT